MIASTKWSLPGSLLAALFALASSLLMACTATGGNPATATSSAAQTAFDKSASDSTASVKTSEPESETDRLNRWFEQKFEEGLQRSPLFMTVLGRKERYAEFDDVSEANEDAELEIARANARELKAFDYDALSDEAKLSRDIWLYQHERDLDAAEFRDHSFVFDQMNGAQSFFPTFMINFHRVDEAEDMTAYIARLSGVANALRTLLERAQKYAAGDVRPPRFAYEGVIDQSKKIISGAPFSSSDQDAAIWQDAKSKIAGLVEAGKIDSAQAEELTRATKSALLSDFAPAYQTLINWLQSDIDNTRRIATGVGALPRGEAYYEERLRASTTTEMTAKQVHELGLREVDRLTAEMHGVLEQVDFDGNLQEFFAFIRDGKQFYYPDTDAGRQGYLDDAEAKLDFIEARLPDYFGLRPKGGLVVKRVEAFREQDGAAQHYSSGTPDGSRPGIYYVHLSDMSAVPANQLEVIAYHEGLPGHHMQIAIAQELQSVPTFRRQINFTAYVEGWALYSEWLAIEMGAYDDPYANFGRITSELWRAIRLVVDTGLHSMGWTEQQAIDYFSANSPEPLESITSEVQRYIVLPGQATSYKIGMLKIQELRRKAEAALGNRFDIRGFHDTVLGGGALPLALLERRIEQWIAAQK